MFATRPPAAARIELRPETRTQCLAQPCCSREDDGTISALLLIAAGMYIAGTVDDIAMAPTAARRYNARFENVAIVPQLNAHGGGVAVLGRF